MSRPSITQRVAVAAALLAVAVLATVPGTGRAEAFGGGCPAGYNCFYSGPDGTGHVWRFAGDNIDTSSYAIATQSGWNNGISGLRACGYRNWSYDGLNYSRRWHDQETFSARTIGSMRWRAGAC